MTYEELCYIYRQEKGSIRLQPFRANFSTRVANLVSDLEKKYAESAGVDEHLLMNHIGKILTLSAKIIELRKHKIDLSDGVKLDTTLRSLEDNHPSCFSGRKICDYRGEHFSPGIVVSTQLCASANMLEVIVGTNTPQGGNTTHGGRTFFSLRNDGNTDWTVFVNGTKIRDAHDFEEITLILRGDTEASTFFNALIFASKILKQQMIHEKGKVMA